MKGPKVATMGRIANRSPMVERYPHPSVVDFPDGHAEQEKDRDVFVNTVDTDDKELVIKEPVLRVERRAMTLSNRLTTATTAI